MGFFDGLNPISSIITAATPIVQSLIDLIPSDNKEAQAKLAELKELLAASERSDVRQVEVNKEEARHHSIFVAGWRPFIGWGLGFSVVLYYIPKAVLTSYFWVLASIQANGLVPYPEMDSGLWELVVGLLGMGSLRSLDKYLTRKGR